MEGTNGRVEPKRLVRQKKPEKAKTKKMKSEKRKQDYQGSGAVLPPSYKATSKKKVFIKVRKRIRELEKPLPDQKRHDSTYHSENWS